jgi:maleate isomerase
MSDHINKTSSLLPVRANFKMLAYCCTSAASVLGTERVESVVREGCVSPIENVTDPIAAATAACQHLGVSRIGLVSPYVAEINKIVQNSLTKNGIDVVSYGSFEQEEEFLVARISQESVYKAAVSLARDAEQRNSGMEAIFIACTNLQTLDIIARIETETGIPCFSSNLALCWHMANCVNADSTEANIELDVKQLGSSMLLEKEPALVAE